MLRLHKKQLLIILLLLLALTLSWGLLAAAGGESLPRSVISSGGGMVSQDGLVLHSAIGQPIIGAVQNGETLCSGYLCGADAPPVSGGSFGIYLPILVR